MQDDSVEPEMWLLQLKRAYDAGHYKTEASLGEQEHFPWQGKTCGDCPFWLDTEWCQVHAEDRHATAHTCSYFDRANQAAGRTTIEERQRRSRRQFWDWLADHR